MVHETTPTHIHQTIVHSSIPIARTIQGVREGNAAGSQPQHKTTTTDPIYLVKTQTTFTVIVSPKLLSLKALPRTKALCVLVFIYMWSSEYSIRQAGILPTFP